MAIKSGSSVSVRVSPYQLVSAMLRELDNPQIDTQEGKQLFEGFHGRSLITAIGIVRLGRERGIDPLSIECEW